MGIIHRDVKLENFLLDITDTDTNDEVVVKLTDFGLAVLCPPKGKVQSNKPVGTFMSMAPEIINCEAYNHKVDCWSLGVILFELVSNEMPFHSDDRDIIKFKITSQVLRLSEMPNLQNVSPECLDLIDKLLTKDPKARLSVTEALQHPWFDVLNGE